MFGIKFLSFRNSTRPDFILHIFIRSIFIQVEYFIYNTYIIYVCKMKVPNEIFYLELSNWKNCHVTGYRCLSISKQFQAAGKKEAGQKASFEGAQ